jgi:hypothetical protein
LHEGVEHGFCSSRREVDQEKIHPPGLVARVVPAKVPELAKDASASWGTGVLASDQGMAYEGRPEGGAQGIGRLVGVATAHGGVVGGN